MEHPNQALGGCLASRYHDDNIWVFVLEVGIKDMDM